MNTSNLHELIHRYEDNYALVNNAENEEIFKWEALNTFRKVWFSDEYKDMSFSQRFKLAMKDSSVLINARTFYPTTGVEKIAETCPEVEQLFYNTIFSGERDPSLVQDNMDKFMDEMEKLRQATFPGFYRYKQDRHAVSCYLFFFDPATHYIYRYSDAEAFAVYTEFGKDLGAGESFSLANYYELADIVVSALKEHPSLIKKNKELIDSADKYYHDDSLHLMAFDLMYCCRCYNLYRGLTCAAKKESLKEYTLQKLREAEVAERAKKIEAIEEKIQAIDLQINDFEEISLLNVEVTQNTYGVGIVTEQVGNRIKVKFNDIEKSYILHKKYPMRPKFEDDAEIVETFTMYNELVEKKKRLSETLASAMK